jgi:predicted DNA-binding ribbon-helix-helix protein
MSAMSIRLPESLHKRLRELAKRENVSMNQLVTLAVAEKVSALDTIDYLSERANRADRSSFERALVKVADREPDPEDELE